MLRIGLTGGIGAGKSTVSATFAECGGIIVDGDVIAREVVEPGTEGLSQLVEAFGEDILLPDGALNRPALAARAFVDDEKRAALNGIVHPLVARRREEILNAVHEDAVVVEDIPLLVETGLAPLFPLVVVVTADIETRVTRVVARGMDEADARARIKAQAPEDQRRAIADVLLDNSGSQGELVEKARDVWYDRVLPLAHNIRMRQCAPAAYELVPYQPTWPDDARRIHAELPEHGVDVTGERRERDIRRVNHQPIRVDDDDPTVRLEHRCEAPEPRDSADHAGDENERGGAIPTDGHDSRVVARLLGRERCGPDRDERAGDSYPPARHEPLH